MQGTQEDIDNAIASLVETKLLAQIQIIYEDITTTSKNKKEERERCTKKFVEMCAKELVLTEDRIRNIVYSVITNAKWIKEIEELEDER